MRDGVGLNEKKVVKDGCKFDMEILETGLKGHFYLELVVREGDLEEEMKKQLAIVFQGIQQGEIRLGRKKTRGFGAFKITRLSVRSYGKDNYLKYADAYKASTWEKASNELENWLHTDSDSRRMIHIEVPLVMKGGISIRQYAAKKNEPDFVHITSNGVRDLRQQLCRCNPSPGRTDFGRTGSRRYKITCEEKRNSADHVWIR